MTFKVLVSDEAKLDLEDTFLYYRNKTGKRIADNFIKDFRNSLKVISKNPFFRIYHDDFRAKPMQTYPFLIFFILDEVQKTIVVSRIFHTSRNPEKYL